MTTYNTGNPIGSADPKDLYDNAENLDELVNSGTKTEHPDRLGTDRKTWHGMETEFNASQAARQADFDADQSQRDAEFSSDQSAREAEFNAFIVASGYIGTGAGGAYQDYDADGPITIGAYNEIFTKDGEFYRAKPSTSLPYTTTGSWASDQVDFVGIGDAALRSELQQDSGGQLIGTGAVTKVTDVSVLIGLTGSISGQKVETQGYHPDSIIGGAAYFYDASGSKDDHDGGSVISPTVPWNGTLVDRDDFLNGVGETDPGGTGVWRLSYDNGVNFYQFGAVGTETDDDYQPCQNFLNFIAVTSVPSADTNGNFGLTAGLILDGGLQPTPGIQNTATREITGSPRFSALDVIDTMLTIHNFSTGIWNGIIWLEGEGGTLYSARTCRLGCEISRSGRARFGGFYCRYYRYGGVLVTSETKGNTSAVELGIVRGNLCGTGSRAANSSLSATWSNRTDTGTQFSGSQKSTVDVDVMPPADLLTERDDIWVRYNDAVYRVTDMDDVAGTISTTPWLELGETTGTFDYIVGGALLIKGSDAGIVGADMVDAINCGVGVDMMSLYGPNISRVINQNNGIGINIGLRFDSAMVTCNIGSLYSEGNTCDIYQLTSTTSDGGWVVGAEYAINYNKCLTNSTRGNDGSLRYGDFIVMLQRTGQIKSFEKQGRNRSEASTSRPITLLNTKCETETYLRNSWTFRVDLSGADFNRLYGYDSKRLVIIGTGTNGAPTGTITFNQESGMTATINGGTTASFTGFKGPAVFTLYYDYDDDNVTVACSSLELKGEATYDPASLADGASATTTVTVTGAELGDFAKASFDNDLQGVTIAAWVSAADTVSVKFTNNTGGVIDLASGTLAARVEKA